MSIGTKIIVLLVITVTLTMIAHGYFSIQQDQENLMRGASLGMRGLAHAIKSALENIYADDRNLSVTQNFVDAIGPQGNVHGLIVFNPSGDPVAVSASLRDRSKAPEFDPTPILSISPDQVLRDSKVVEGYIREPGVLIYYRAEPIIGSDGRFAGAFVVTRYGKELITTIRDRRNRIVMTTASLVFLLSASVLIVVRRSIVVPINNLVGRIREIGRGDWQQRIDATGRDEIASLASEFNSMSGHLQETYARLIQEQDDRFRLERDLRHSERLAAVGQLAAGLAHEIGTPLSIISGRAEHLLRRPRNADEIRSNLQTVLSQSERIAAIVRQLLDFSRRREPAKTNLDLPSLISKVKELFEPQLEHKGIRFEMAFPESLPALRADGDLLQQVFINLFTNALHALPAGGSIRIRIEPRSPAQTGGSADRLGPGMVIFFEDNGAGIAPENLARVFDPFFTTKDVGEGSGLGLSVTFGIIKDHGGDISVESELGEFTRFKIELPNSASHSTSAPPRGIL